ncbi:hypothetical protein BJF90_31115 [Pseudonocardia sp. CNS-004]|nr:hypothetical protein BJF90_31115 [Pseudonocardia sp. CNS-004]
MLAHARELGEEDVALAHQVGELRAYLLLLGAGGGTGLVADLGGFLFRGLQDALHAVGEVADDVRALAARLLRMTGARLLRRGPRAARRGHASGRGDEGHRVAAGHVEIGAHPGHHTLETGHVFVDLLAVVAPQDDVETGGAERARITRHPWSPPERESPSTRRG